jgi:hypothetical protein
MHLEPNSKGLVPAAALLPAPARHDVRRVGSRERLHDLSISLRDRARCAACPRSKENE